jgi:hypothetical protein
MTGCHTKALRETFTLPIRVKLHRARTVGHNREVLQTVPFDIGQQKLENEVLLSIGRLQALL